MENKPIEKEVLEILREEYFADISYDTYSKSFTINRQPLNINKFNFAFMDKHNIRISDDNMRNLLVNGCENTYSSIQNFLETCQLNYGTNNAIDTLGKDILKCQTQIEEIYLKKFLVSAVSRVYNPGSQVDQVFILQSKKQGIYKTSFFRSLVGVDNFAVIRPNMNETELVKLCSCFWFLCYDELDSFLTKHTISKMKSFITTTHDTWRRFYTTSEFEKVPRTFVLCGTTNKDEFLVDTTGERRFWIVNVNHKIDMEWVKQNRERIWSEAVHLYKEGYQWWLTDEEQVLSNELNQTYKKLDTTTQLIFEYVETKKENQEPFRLKDLLSDLDLKHSNNSITEVLVDICGLEKPVKHRSVKNVKGYWWNLE